MVPITRPPILIGVVAWNGRRWLERCLESLLDDTSDGDQLVVVDNGSSDGTSTWLQDRFGGQVEVIERPRNEGFAAGCNHLLEAMWSRGMRAVLILNQDVWIERGTLDILVQALEDASMPIGLLIPLQLNYDEGDSFDPAFERFLVTHDINPESLETETVVPLPTVIGAAMLIPCEAVAQVGGFDPFYFCYAEDDDFVRRLRFHGLGCGLVTQARLHHYHTKDRPEMPKWLARKVIRNGFIFFLKNPEGSFLSVIWRYLKRGLWSTVRNNGPLKDPRYLLYCLWLQFYTLFTLPRTYLTRQREKAGPAHLGISGLRSS